ncbi:uroporphyrinogen-III synthase [Granulicella sibirica]|uniref:Uroporphyrinogen-III synthase n=1 Tax=Granulicella sibirica TaxID=2479048 RepID=A0A4Q0T297_9BACT|nr:uroporphyrinogen-III synthase [Granulicella sibirica]RXH56039.1 Uroporphyrinogen-III methyltransferase [Granulicella sibirica]
MLPLAHRRIVITRSRHQASELAARVEALGGTAILIPTIELVPPESYAGLDAAIGEVEGFDWVVFTSANAVKVFVERRNHLGAGLEPARVAVIGGATARVARDAGLRVDLVPEVAVAEALAVEMLLVVGAGAKVLLVRAAVGRDYLVSALREADVEVTIAEAYRTVAPEASVTTLRKIFGDAGQYPDAITFTSSSTAGNLRRLLEAAGVELPREVVRGSIGPITSGTLRELGWGVDLEAREATFASLAEGLAEYFSVSEISSRRP